MKTLKHGEFHDIDLHRRHKGEIHRRGRRFYLYVHYGDRKSFCGSFDLGEVDKMVLVASDLMNDSRYIEKGVILL